MPRVSRQPAAMRRMLPLQAFLIWHTTVLRQAPIGFACAMSKTPKPETAEVSILRNALRAYLDRQGMRDSALARRAKVSQSQVSRFFGGHIKSVTSDVRRLCRAANIHVSEIPESDGATRLSEAAKRAWDGRPETLEGLAAFIEWVGPRFCGAWPPRKQAQGAKRAKRRNRIS